MRQRRHGDYRAEFAACQPDTSVDAAELAIAGFDSHLYYYRRLIPLAASLPAPQPPLPHHLLNDTSGLTTRLLAPFGVPVPWSSM